MRNTKDVIYRLSAMFILISALLYLFEPMIAPWMMAVSVVLFAGVTLLSPYKGKSIRGKRLYNFQVIACLMMAIATYLMFAQRSEWALFMIIGAIFLLYSAFMLPKVSGKEDNEGGSRKGV